MEKQNKAYKKERRKYENHEIKKGRSPIFDRRPSAEPFILTVYVLQK